MRIMNWKLQNNSPFSEQYSSVLFTERGIISKVQPRRPHLLSAPLPAVSPRHQIFTNASRMQIFSIKVEPAWFIFACGRLSWIVRWGEQRLAPRLQKCFFTIRFCYYLCENESKRGAFVVVRNKCAGYSVYGPATWLVRHFLVIRERMIRVSIF